MDTHTVSCLTRSLLQLLLEPVQFTHSAILVWIHPQHLLLLSSLVLFLGPNSGHMVRPAYRQQRRREQQHQNYESGVQGHSFGLWLLRHSLLLPQRYSYTRAAVSAVPYRIDSATNNIKQKFIHVQHRHSDAIIIRFMSLTGKHYVTSQR